MTPKQEGQHARQKNVPFHRNPYRHGKDKDAREKEMQWKMGWAEEDKRIFLEEIMS